MIYYALVFLVVALIAGVLGFKAREFFATGDDAEREPVKVDLR